MKNLTIMLLFAPLLVFSQKSIHYKINIVKSDFFNDKELLIAPAIFTTANEYNESNIKIISIAANKNHFHLNGTVKYPMPISFSYVKKEGKNRIPITSDFIFLDNGSFDVTIDDLSFNKEVRGSITSSSNDEYRNLKARYKDLEVDKGFAIVTEKGNIQKKDEVLKSYIQSHPDSYVAMWVLIFDYQMYGYSNTKNEMVHLFSKKISGTLPLKTLLKKIKVDKKLMVNNNFPYNHFPFGQDVANTVKKSTYTLVDFWASTCKPCIAQFSALKKIYNSNKLKGFNIYSISTDKKIDIKSMDSILTSNQIEWKNETDINGSQSYKLNIHGIPTSFLLDSGGKIITKNISMKDLEIFLKEKG